MTIKINCSYRDTDEENNINISYDPRTGKFNIEYNHDTVYVASSTKANITRKQARLVVGVMLEELLTMETELYVSKDQDTDRRILLPIALDTEAVYGTNGDIGDEAEASEFIAGLDEFGFFDPDIDLDGIEDDDDSDDYDF